MRIKCLMWAAIGFLFLSSCSPTEPENKRPKAIFTHTMPTCINIDITFDASQSRDPDGKITKVQWSFGDGTSASNTIVTKRYLSVGDYSVSLTVQDNDGARTTTRGTLKVTAEPSIDCDANPGCYTLDVYRWPVVNGIKWVQMTLTTSFRSLDPGWISISDNSAMRAMSEWHWNSCANIGFSYGSQVLNLGKAPDGYNSVSAGYIDGPGGNFGTTYAHLSNNKVIEVDIVIEAEAWGVNGESDKYDLVSTMTHEMGHVWRLEDLTAPSCYWETMHQGPEKGMIYRRTLGCGDRRGVQALYGFGCRAYLAKENAGDCDALVPPRPIIIVAGDNIGGDS